MNPETPEVELLSAVCSFFESVGITSSDVGLKVNSRKVLNAVVRTVATLSDNRACNMIYPYVVECCVDVQRCPDLDNKVSILVRAHAAVVASAFHALDIDFRPDTYLFPTFPISDTSKFYTLQRVRLCVPILFLPWQQQK